MGKKLLPTTAAAAASPFFVLHGGTRSSQCLYAFLPDNQDIRLTIPCLPPPPPISSPRTGRTRKTFSHCVILCNRKTFSPTINPSDSMSRWGRKARPPPGFDYLEPTLAALEAELREST